MSHSTSSATSLAKLVIAGDLKEVLERLSELDALAAASLSVQIFNGLQKKDPTIARAFVRTLAAKSSHRAQPKKTPNSTRGQERAINKLLQEWIAIRNPLDRLKIWHEMNNDLRPGFVSRLSKAQLEQLQVLSLFHPSEVSRSDSMAKLKERGERRIPKHRRRAIARDEENARTLGQGYFLATPNSYKPYAGGGWRLKSGRRK